MNFNIQEPNAGKLLKRIDNISCNAQVGVGVFAFASKLGIQALVNSPNVKNLISRGHFTLIVGVDALTNVEALEELLELSNKHEGRFKAFIFLDNENKGIFHPKFSWFKVGDMVNVIAGSGNLTLAGLGAKVNGVNNSFNWEAYGDFSLSGQATKLFLENWQEWIDAQHNANRLRLPRDREVIAKAMQNSRLRWQNDMLAISRNEKRKSAERNIDLNQENETTSKVFVSEIPSGSSRWNQANFRKEDFKNFFGFEAVAGQKVDILLQHITANDEAGEVEVRKPVVVGSKNYRFELGAGRGIGYKKTIHDDRPIAIFVRINTMAFRYCLLMPGEKGYQEVLELLGPHNTSARRTMRQAFLSINHLKEKWFGVPLSLLPSKEVLPEI